MIIIMIIFFLVTLAVRH